MKSGISESELKLQFNEEVNDLKAQIKEQRKSLNTYKKSHGQVASFFREMRAEIDEIKPIKPVYRKTKQSGKSAVVPVLHFTDWHYGACQVADEIEGFGEFSPEICEDRTRKIVEKVIDWTELHKNNYSISELVVIVTGDMISGDIHDELKITNAFPAPVQTLRSGYLLADRIAELAPYFEHVRVEMVTEDNHGRLTKIPQCKEAGYNNFCYLVAAIAKDRLKSHSNVRFNIYPQYEKSINVAGSRYLILHGHGIMGWAGFPYYGIERKVAKEALRRMNMPDVNKFDKVVMGHWHAPLAHPWYWIGGSLSGTDAYDHKAGRYSKPSQAAWMVHPKHGEFDRTDFWL